MIKQTFSDTVYFFNLQRISSVQNRLCRFCRNHIRISFFQRDEFTRICHCNLICLSVNHGHCASRFYSGNNKNGRIDCRKLGMSLCTAVRRIQHNNAAVLPNISDQIFSAGFYLRRTGISRNQIIFSLRVLLFKQNQILRVSCGRTLRIKIHIFLKKEYRSGAVFYFKGFRSVICRNFRYRHAVFVRCKHIIRI